MREDYNVQARMQQPRIVKLSFSQIPGTWQKHAPRETDGGLIEVLYQDGRRTVMSFEPYGAQIDADQINERQESCAHSQEILLRITWLQ